jgi:hypothetical protein
VGRFLVEVSMRSVITGAGVALALALPALNPAARAAEHDWVAVPNTSDLICVDRQSIHRQGRNVLWSQAVCESEGREPASPERDRVDCSQDMSGVITVSTQTKESGRWLETHVRPEAMAASSVRLVCEASRAPPRRPGRR